jgi:hypothetical protein
MLELLHFAQQAGQIAARDTGYRAVAVQDGCAGPAAQSLNQQPGLLGCYGVRLIILSLAQRQPDWRWFFVKTKRCHAPMAIGYGFNDSALAINKGQLQLWPG